MDQLKKTHKFLDAGINEIFFALEGLFSILNWDYDETCPRNIMQDSWVLAEVHAPQVLFLSLFLFAGAGRSVGPLIHSDLNRAGTAPCFPPFDLYVEDLGALAADLKWERS